MSTQENTATVPETALPCECALRFKQCKGNCDHRYNSRLKEEATVVQAIFKALKETASTLDMYNGGTDEAYWSLRALLNSNFTDLFSLNFLTLDKEQLLELSAWVSKWGMVNAGVFLMRIRFMFEGGTMEGEPQQKLTASTFDEDFETLAGELPFVKRVNNEPGKDVRSIVFDELQLSGDVLTKIFRWINVRGLKSRLLFSPDYQSTTLEVISPE